jgi:quinoprotein glucose dehydrogenase
MGIPAIADHNHEDKSGITLALKPPDMTGLKQAYLVALLTSVGCCFILPDSGQASNNTSRREAVVPYARDTDWPNVGNDRGAMRYSPLKQIDRFNVTELEVAWTYHTGDADPKRNTTIECTPIVVGGVMYLTTVSLKVVALDAATGREVWMYDPYADDRLRKVKAAGVNRGVAYWTDGKVRRVLVGLPSGWLISLDAKTGTPDPGFGKGGMVDLRENMGRDLSGVEYGATSAPAVYKDTVILGFICGEGPGFEAPGDVRAFNVRTGKETWRFRTVPGPGEYGNETWENDSWKNHGAANNWSGTTLDEKRGLVFVGTGTAAGDFYGGDRLGDNLFGNCTIALDAKTGKRIWHFQTIRHDLSDHDLPYPPIVCTIKQNGRKIDAVAQVSKTGYCYLFDRVTGRPLFPIQEVPAPRSDIPGERAATTQPVPTKPPPFSRQSITESDITDISPEAHEEALKRFRTYRVQGPFVPPSLNGSMTVPGLLGGATWAGASYDPTTGILYVNSNNLPYVLQLQKNPEGSPYPYKIGGYRHFRDINGYPAIKPPWGLLTAIDLGKGEFLWQVPLGEYPELKARGIPPTGTENFGGTIVTAGGLVFVGGSKDEKFHAFDRATGKLLWEKQLPAGGYATPCTYAVNGRQYVVIAGGGGGKNVTKSGDAYVAFALPSSSTSHR